MANSSASAAREDRTYQRKEGLLTASVKDAVLMMSVELGAYFSLDSIGGAIWTLLETPQRLDDLVAALASAYDGEEKVIRTELGQFLARLETEGLLKPAA